VSPNEVRIHDFIKEANMFFMPCTSEPQIPLMGQVYRRFAKELRNCHTDAVIHQRVKNVGPFIRTAVCWESTQMKQFINNCQEEIEGLVTDPTKLRSHSNYGTCYWQAFISSFSTIRGSSRQYLSLLGYTDDKYEFSCDNVLRLIQVAIAQMGIQVVKAHLIAINQDGIGLSDRLHVFLERIFEFHCIDESITWSNCPMLLEAFLGEEV
jgi:hypothetical protein